jgi:hypothetical protein
MSKPTHKTTPDAAAGERPAAGPGAADFRPVDESAIRRPFAATLDLKEMTWQFLGPVAGVSAAVAAAALLPNSPEAAIWKALREIVERVMKKGRVTPQELMATAKGRFLHLSGQASAADVGQQLVTLLVRSYLESAKAGGASQGAQVRPTDDSRIEVRLDSKPDPVLPPSSTAELGPGVPFPASPLDSVRGLRLALAPHHQPVVGMVQQLLDEFVGKHAPSLDENRAVAAAVNAAADDHGVALLYDGRPVTLRVIATRSDTGGSYQARLIGSDQRILKTSRAFPPLTAVAKATVTAATARSADDRPTPPAA